MNEHAHRVLVCAAALALAGCAAGPDFARPATPVPTRYTLNDALVSPDRVQTLRPVAAPPARWWQSFGSPALDALVDGAVAASPTMESARAALAQAEALLAAANGARYPQLSVAASAGRAGDAAENQFSLGPQASVNLDVAGGTRRRIEQAQALAAFQRAQLLAAQLNLAGNTVLQFIAAASARAQIVALDDIVAVDTRNLALVQLSEQAGKSARLDVLTAQSQLASDRAQLPALEQQVSVARHALAVLSGKSSAEWSPPASELSSLALPGEIPLLLPAELVRRHPDILAAQAQLAAASAGIGVATAQLYPSLNLSARWDRSASTAGGWFGGGDSLWNVTANLMAPIFNGHTLRAEREAAIQAYAVQLGNYRQALLSAFGRVADAMAALNHAALQADAERQALDTAQAALALTQEGYQAGQSSLLQLLQAQRLYQQARLGYARAVGQRYAYTAQLFIALGGSSELIAQPPAADAP